MARISTGTMTVAIFAVLFGLVGAYALRAALVGDAPPPSGPRTTVVPLAAHELPAGRRIAAGDMVLVPMTQADLESRGLPLDRTMLSADQIVGRVLDQGIKQGDGFLTTNLYPEGTGPKLSDKLQPGMRAVTIPVDNLAAVGGSTVEGSYVDVLFRARARAADPNSGRPEIPSTTVTLLENVEVLAVDRLNVAANNNRSNDNVDLRNRNPVMAGGSNYSGNPVVSVTIAVSPDQANVVKAVSGQGDMSLALRGEKGAASTVSPNKYTLEDILGVKQVAADTNRIEVFRGGQSRQSLTFGNGRRTVEEMSMVPGVAPSTHFPIPATLPTQNAPVAPAMVPQPTYPQPYLFQGGGFNRGAMGWNGAYPYGG